MSIGLLGLTNHTLLREIRERFPDAIHAVDDFIKTIKPGETFFKIIAAPEVGLSSVDSECLVLTKMYDGEFKAFKGTIWYKVKCDSQEHSLTDLLGGANACFKDYQRAKCYHDSLAFHWKNLIGSI